MLFPELLRNSIWNFQGLIKKQVEIPGSIKICVKQKFCFLVLKYQDCSRFCDTILWNFHGSLLNYVPYVLPYPTCLVPHVPRTLRAPVPQVPCALRAFCLTCLVPNVLSCLTCLRCSCTSRVLYLACSRAGSNSTCSFAPRPLLASGVSSECISCAFFALAI